MHSQRLSKHSLAILLGGLILIAGRFADAQSDIPKEKQATVAFDIRVDEMMSDLISMGVEKEMLDDANLPDPLDGFKLTDIKRVFGATSLPPDTQTAMNSRPPVPPLEFYVRVQFANPEMAEKALQKLIEEGGEYELDGKKYAVAEEDTPEAMMAHLVDSSTLELGTGFYVKQADRRFSSPGLSTALRNAPDTDYRVVIDVAGNRSMVNDAKEQSKGMLPPPFPQYLALVDNIETITLGADLKQPKLVDLQFHTNDQGAASELKEALESLVAMAKLQIPKPADGEQMPTAMTLGIQMMDSMTLNTDDKVVSLTLPRLEGFEEMVKNGLTGAKKAADRASQMNDMRQFALGVLNYEATFQEFPFQPKRTNSDLSWRVRVLPYMEELELYKKFDMEKGPDEEPNASLADQMPELFGSDGKNANVAWIKSDVKGFRDITDGSSNTIMLIQFPKGMPWTKNQPLAAEDAIEMVAGMPDGQSIIVAFYDGSVRQFSNTIDKDTLRKLFDPKDGQVIDRDW